MTTYTVLVAIDASTTVEVEADSEEVAKEKAMDKVGIPTLCWHCAQGLDVGDPIEAVEATPN